MEIESKHIIVTLTELLDTTTDILEIMSKKFKSQLSTPEKEEFHSMYVKNKQAIYTIKNKLLKQ